MATIVLTAVGSLVGGPLGGALGAMAGRQIDGAVFGGGSREGPRVKDLAVTTSSFGQPIPRHFGAVRAAGTIIWSTDLKENKESSGGGKGQPKTTSYSYSVSFAVALSSRPIAGIGRIWADGNLLRGAAGDLKTTGIMRIYKGWGDMARDPLIAASEADAPAFRDCAYVVFEELSLADFGNRIPALTFEIFADTQDTVGLGSIANIPFAKAGNARLDHMRGFSDEGGQVLSSISAIDQVYPLICITGPDGVELSQMESSAAEPPMLPPALLDDSNDDGRNAKLPETMRSAASDPKPRAIRYYDAARDYQPNVQRAGGEAEPGRELMLDMPATLDAGGAKDLVAGKARRDSWRADKLSWRIAELDPSLKPGMVVRVPDRPGLWQISSWEWLDRGIELELQRQPPTSLPALSADSGRFTQPQDRQSPSSILQVFEVPWSGSGSSASTNLFAAATAASDNWAGATLYLDRAGELEEIGQVGPARSVIGALSSPLEPSDFTCFQPTTEMFVELVADDLEFPSTTWEGLAQGRNRLLLGGWELVQYATATKIGTAAWRLSGLLRGRGGTEQFCDIPHASGTGVVLLDSSIVPLDLADAALSSRLDLAAIGFGDNDPVSASAKDVGCSRRPLSPVHALAAPEGSTAWKFSWTRRARGAWYWQDGVDVPLTEETERYQLGVGPTDDPVSLWETSSNEFVIPTSELTHLPFEGPERPFWIRQIGTFGVSPAARFAPRS